MRLGLALVIAVAGSTVMLGQARVTSEAKVTGALDTAPAPVAETSVKAVLKKPWDSKSARVGDRVIALTQTDVTLPDGRVLPKGSEIRGNVMSETTFSPNTGRGVLTFLFDEVKIKGLKKKKAMASVHAVIHVAEPPAKSSAAGGELKDDSGVVDTTSAAMAQGASAAVAPSVATGSSADAVARPNANVGQSSMPGIRLSARASSGASGTLIAVGQELQIKKGTVLTFGLSAAE